jgi:CHAT domain-containing protein
LFVGGVDYDYTETATKKADSNTIAYLDTNNIKGLRASKSRGESWNYLPGTLMEINQLQNIIKTHENEISTLTGNKATETNFKKLSGNSPNIIHIATHGFFFENQNIKPRYGMSLSTEDQYRLAEDPLLRSGIMMAGANYAWKHGSNPMEDDDGILTAMEISNLDLSDTDMVVLSACETGLGDIDGSEGVYGLQRAFKMSGVNIIVMSLWQVPDKETAEFMTMFYSKWKASNNVREAFNITQRSMQHKYKKEPEKWAAFVLFE